MSIGADFSLAISAWHQVYEAEHQAGEGPQKGTKCAKVVGECVSERVCVKSWLTFAIVETNGLSPRRKVQPAEFATQLSTLST